ncbi:MAG: nucleotide sugar dehydrogenase [Thermoplasmata archaeon]|nr:nucleotide sugar dehydrogenase [Thermoplasmata archaeon]
MVSKIIMNDAVVCVVGLGYVGMPLAEAFAKHVRVIGFDINEKKVKALKEQYPSLELTADPKNIKQADVVIIAVPTPVTKSKEPDLSPVISASRLVGQNLKKGAIVVLESTVYPGVTEEIMGPILEKESGLKIGQDFSVGYSPERVNPGDSAHSIDKIVKIVSGMDTETTDVLSALYSKITQVFIAKNIKTAEAAKVIENVQRDLNIALMNELSMIFHKIGLDTKEVLDAASTKWNFIRFSPGLVGGHCIPVDPYYLVYKARELGYHSQVILAGRSINDYMPKHVALLAIKALNQAGKVMKDSKVLIMGLTYKENVPDTRESPVSQMVKELKEFGMELFGYDPLLTPKEIERFGIKPVEGLSVKTDCVIIAVAHEQFKAITLDVLKTASKENPVLIDVRRIFDEQEAKKKGFLYYTL